MTLMIPGCRASFWIAPGEPLQCNSKQGHLAIAQGTLVLLRVMLYASDAVAPACREHLLSNLLRAMPCVSDAVLAYAGITCCHATPSGSPKSSPVRLRSWTWRRPATRPPRRRPRTSSRCWVC